ncbi:MAG: hypothetical protein ACUVRS_03160 [Armatimonadota bacterium]
MNVTVVTIADFKHLHSRFIGLRNSIIVAAVRFQRAIFLRYATIILAVAKAYHL